MISFSPYLTCAHPDIANLADQAQKAKLPTVILHMHRDRLAVFFNKTDNLLN